jgi:hypothetical protein
LIRLDLPTLERPTKATSGNSAGGYWDGLVALVTNSADLMIMALASVYWQLVTGF